MTVDARGDKAARGTALRGAGVGLLLAAALLGPALLTGGVPARGDLPDFFWPMKAYTAERWAAGAVPLWNPLSGVRRAVARAAPERGPLPGRPPVPPRAGGRVRSSASPSTSLSRPRAPRSGSGSWAARGRRPSSRAASTPAAARSSLSCPSTTTPARRRGCPGSSRAREGSPSAGPGGAGLAIAVAGAFLAGRAGARGRGKRRRRSSSLSAPGPKGSRRRRRSLVPGWSYASASRSSRASRSRARRSFPFGALLRESGALTAGRHEERRWPGPSGRRTSRTSSRPLVRKRPGPRRRAEAGTSSPSRSGPLPLLLAAGVGAGLPGRRRFLAGLAVLADRRRPPRARRVRPPRAAPLRRRPPPRPPLPGALGRLSPPRARPRGGCGARRLALGPLPCVKGRAAGRRRLRRRRARRRPAAGSRSARRRRGRFSSASSRPSRGPPRGPCRAGPGPDPRRARRGPRAASSVLATARLRPGGASPGAATVVAVARARSRCPSSPGRRSLRRRPGRGLPAPAALGDLARTREAGRVFAPAGQDRTLALRWKYADGAAWGEGAVDAPPGRSPATRTSSTESRAVSSASPIGNPREDRLVGAALAGGDAPSSWPS